MIIVVGGIKGGSGKTTLATNLTVLRSNENKKVLLVDADEQKSAIDWATAREIAGIRTSWTTIQLAGMAIRSQIQKLKEHYNDIIIDVGGRDTTSQRAALTIADVFLTPFQPSSADVWTLSALKTLLSDILTVNDKLISYAVVNRGEPKGEDNQETLEILTQCNLFKCNPIIIGQRKIFKKAWAEGMGINEFKQIDKKAIQEMKSLYEMIYS